MDFAFDHNQIPIIGSKYWDILSHPVSAGDTMDVTRYQSFTAADTGSLSTGTSSNDGPVSSWKRPLSSQVFGLVLFSAWCTFLGHRPLIGLYTLNTFILTSPPVSVGSLPVYDVTRTLTGTNKRKIGQFVELLRSTSHP